MARLPAPEIQTKETTCHSKIKAANRAARTKAVRAAKAASTRAARTIQASSHRIRTRNRVKADSRAGRIIPANDNNHLSLGRFSRPRLTRGFFL